MFLSFDLQIIAWFVFAGSVIFFAVVSAVLNYHWNKYGLAKVEHLGRLRAVYFTVAGLLVVGAIITGLL